MNQGAHIHTLLGFMGVSAFVVSSIGSYASSELEILAETPTADMSKVILAYIGFCIMNFSTYSLVPVFIQRSGAALLSISNLTTVGWSMMADIFLFGKDFRLSYMLAFSIEMMAIIVYCLKEPEEVPQPSQESKEDCRILKIESSPNGCEKESTDAESNLEI